jgi:hypothetical protein
MLVWTNMGSDLADFFITTPHRVAFVHAKAAIKKRYCSASALHDVVIQVFALLQATWGLVSQLGARLRIFCSP